MPQPMKKRQKLAPGQERSVKVRLRSFRNPPLDMICSGQSLSTSIHDLKQSVSEQSAIPSDKTKLLYKKKPCPDSKTLKELLADGDVDVEFSVMVMGGAPSTTVDTPVESQTPAEGAPEASVAQGPSGEALLESEQFWEDLKGFMMQRLKDEKISTELKGVFREAWAGHSRKR